MSETAEKKTTAIAVANNKEELVSLVSNEWNRSADEVNAMISVSFPTLKTLGQLTVAFGIAKKYDLDPMVKEMYAYIDHRGNLTTIVGKDGFMKIARRQEGYVSLHSVAVYPGDEFEMDFAEMKVLKHRMGGDSMKSRTGNPIGAYAVLRMKDKPDVVNWVDWSEYAGTSGPWTKQKAAMIRKCAVAVLCREAFGMSGLYDEAEIFDAEEIGLKIGPADAKLAAPSERLKRPEPVAAQTAPVESEAVEAEAVEEPEPQTEPEPEKEPEPAPSKRKVSTAKNLREANDEIAKNVESDPQFQEVFGTPKTEAAAENPDAPGKDQLARIAELQKELGEEYDAPETREGAASIIKNLLEALEEKKRAEQPQTAPVKETPATAEEAADVFGDEEQAEDPKAGYLEFYADYDEAQIKEAGADAKARFAEALKMKRDNPTKQNVEALTEVTAELAALKQIFTERGYAKG